MGQENKKRRVSFSPRELFLQACLALESAQATEAKKRAELEEDACNLLSQCIESLEAQRKGKGGEGGGEPPAIPPHYSLDNTAFLLCVAHIECGKAKELKNGLHDAEKHYRTAIQVFPATVEGRVNLALLLRAEGRSLDEAEGHLREAMTVARRLEESLRGGDGKESEDDEEDEDEEEESLSLKVQEVESGEVAQHVLALVLTQTERGVEEADKMLAELGYRYRLARPILACAPEALGLEPWPSSGGGGGEQGLADILDDVLPAELLSHLQTAFSPDSCFWREHRYDQPSTVYFSYIYDMDTSPRNSLEQAIKHIHSSVAKVRPTVSKARYAEWWLHSRPHSAGHQLHYDTEEDSLREGMLEGIRCPLVSTVTYLNEAPVGGPTLVIDQKVGEMKLGARGCLVGPRPNRLAMFEGRSLHGVIPGHGVPPSGNGKDRRLTLMVGFWDTIRIQEGGPDVPPGPAMVLPPDGTHEWTKLLPLRDGWGSVQPTRMKAKEVSPVWEPLPAPEGENVANEDREDAFNPMSVKLTYRFFLRDEGEIEEEMMALAAAKEMEEEESKDIDEVVEGLLAQPADTGPDMEALSELWFTLTQGTTAEEEEEEDDDDDDSMEGEENGEKEEHEGGHAGEDDECCGAGHGHLCAHKEAVLPTRSEDLLAYCVHHLGKSGYPLSAKRMLVEIVGALAKFEVVRESTNAKRTVECLVKELSSDMERKDDEPGVGEGASGGDADKKDQGEGKKGEDAEGDEVIEMEEENPGQEYQSELLTSLTNLTARHEANQRSAVENGVLHKMMPRLQEGDELCLTLLWNLMPVLATDASALAEIKPILHQLLQELNQRREEDEEGGDDDDDRLIMLLVGILSFTLDDKETLAAINRVDGIKHLVMSLPLCDEDDASDILEALVRYGKTSLSQDVVKACKEVGLSKEVIARIVPSQANRGSKKRSGKEEGAEDEPKKKTKKTTKATKA